MKDFDIELVYNIYKQLSKLQRKQLLRLLNEQEIFITQIEAFTYQEAPGIKQMFLHFRNKKEAIPYYLLEPDVLRKIQAILTLLAI